MTGDQRPPLRLPKFLRRRAAEQQRVDSFLAAIAATARPVPPIPVPRPLVVAVERVDTPTGPVWQLDADTRAAFAARRHDTVALPRIVARASAPLR